MLFRLLLLVLVLSIERSNAVNECEKEGDILPSNFSINPLSIIGCEGSYFQITIPKMNLTDSLTEIVISETVDGWENIIATIAFGPPFTLIEETKLATKSNNVTFFLRETTTGDPISIHYKEVDRGYEVEEYNYGNGQIILDPLKPNEQIKQIFGSKLDIQKLEVGWNFSSASTSNPVSSISTTFGFLALRNSNGKISLLTGPSGTKIKFAVAMPPRNVTDGNNIASESRIDIVTQNDPEEDTYAESRVGLSYICFSSRLM